MKKNIFFLSLFLTLNSLTIYSQTIFDTTTYNNGIWMYTTNSLSSAQIASLSATNPYIKGAGVTMAWKYLEPSAGNFNWTSLDAQLQAIANNNWFIQIELWVGPSSPFWIYQAPYNVDSVKTNDANNFFYLNRYPYYLHPNYKMLWYRLIDSVSNHIDNLPANIRNKIIIYQSAEGTTGDLDWYKGDPISIPNSTSTCGCTNYSITQTQWYNFTREAWKHTNSIYAAKTPPVHLLINTGGSGQATLLGAPINNFSWANDSLPYVWRKATNFGHMYQMNDEVYFKQAFDPLINVTQPLNSCVTQIRVHDEMDFHQNSIFFLQHAQWNSYWLALSALHNGLDIWNPHYAELIEPRFSDAFNFFKTYAGYKNASCSPGAFSALHDGLDAYDTIRFPSSTFGMGSSTNNAAGKNRCIAIANSYSVYGAKQQDPSAAQGGPLNQLNQPSALNDIGWNIFSGNYERYLTQWNPDSTSQGYWRQGDSTQPYGRFARGFDHSTGKDTIFFNLDNSFFPVFPNNGTHTIKLRLVYLDQGTGTFRLKYDAVGNRFKTAKIYTNTNTNMWISDTITITDGYFGNRSNHGTDIALLNQGNNNKIFHMIEVIKVAPLTTGINEQHNPTNKLITYPNPSQNSITFDYFNYNEETFDELIIYNILGEKVYSTSMDNSKKQITIELKHLPSGIYTSVLIGKNTQLVNKFIKQ